jgi:VIT1/CCC1 family predicted Fe2+/Mn2+ transporter
MSIRKTSKWLFTALWTVQVLLSVMLGWAAWMKLSQTPETLSTMWPWAGEVSPWMVKLTGVADLLAALGLVLPALLNVRRHLTFFAAAGLVLLMLCAMAFHISRGESPAFNVIVAALAGFVAWGRQDRTASLC